MAFRVGDEGEVTPGAGLNAGMIDVAAEVDGLGQRRVEICDTDT